MLKKPSHWNGSFEYPQHMFWMRNKENNFPIRTLIWRHVTRTCCSPYCRTAHDVQVIHIGSYINTHISITIWGIQIKCEMYWFHKFRKLPYITFYRSFKFEYYYWVVFTFSSLFRCNVSLILKYCDNVYERNGKIHFIYKKKFSWDFFEIT